MINKDDDKEALFILHVSGYKTKGGIIIAPSYNNNLNTQQDIEEAIDFLCDEYDYIM